MCDKQTKMPLAYFLKGPFFLIFSLTLVTCLGKELSTPPLIGEANFAKVSKASMKISLSHITSIISLTAVVVSVVVVRAQFEAP